MPGPERGGEAQSSEFTGAQELLSALDVKTHTEINEGANDSVSFRRRAEAAEARVEEGRKMDKLKSITVALMSGKTDSEEVKDYLEKGGSLESALQSIKDYMGESGSERQEQSKADEALFDAREAYIEELTKKPRPFRRRQAKEAISAAEDRYNQAVLDKVEDIFSTDPARALEVGQLPQVIERSSFGGDQPLTLEDLAANHLSVLTDVMLREQYKRTEAIERQKPKGSRRVFNALQKSRGLRAVLAVGIFGAATLPSLGVGGLNESVIHTIETGMQLVSAYAFMQETLHGGTEGLSTMLDQRRHNKAEKALAADERLSDLTLRTAYNSIEYGEAADYNSPIQDRVGTPDAEENRRRFAAIDQDYEIMGESAPGGEKPYSAREVVDFASRLYLDRMPQVAELTQAPDAKERFMQLASDLLKQDLEVLQKRSTESRLKKGIRRGVSIAASIAITKLANQIPEGVRVTREISSIAQGELGTS